jgi:hypothetical protein
LQGSKQLDGRASSKGSRNHALFCTDLPRETLWKGLHRPGQFGALSDQASTGFLPAVAAISAIPAIAASAAALATTPTASAATTTAIATAPASATALGLGPRFVYHQVSPAKVLTVQGIHRTVRIFVAADLHEGETARLAREPVTNQVDSGCCYSCLPQPFLKLLLRRRKRKISHIELLHLELLLPGT